MTLKAMVVMMHRNDVEKRFNKLHAIGGSQSSGLSRVDSSSSIAAIFAELAICFRDIQVTARNEIW